MANFKLEKADENQNFVQLTEADRLVKMLGIISTGYGMLPGEKEYESQEQIVDHAENSISFGIDDFDFSIFKSHHCLAYFFAFVYGCEGNENLKSLLKAGCEKTSEYSLLGEFFEEPDVGIIKDKNIVDKALEYVLDTKSSLATKYILNQGKRLHITGRVGYQLIEDLVKDYLNTMSIIVQLIKNDVFYTGIEKDHLKCTDKRELEEDAKDKSEIDEAWEKSKEDVKLEDTLKHQINPSINSNGLKISEDARVKAALSKSMLVGYEVDYSNLPEFQTKEGGYVEREGIVEAAFRSPNINGIAELEIIVVLYEGFNDIPDKERLMLFKGITAYDKVDLIEAIYELLDNRNNNNIIKKTNASMVFDSRIAMSLNYKLDLIDFISGIVLYAISSDNIVLVQRLIQKFDSVLASKSIEIIDSIVDSLIYQYESDVMITFPFEKLRIICTVSGMCTSNTSSVLKFLSVFENLLYQSTHLNFIVNCYNPVRLFAMMVRTGDKMNDTVTTVNSGFEKLLEGYDVLVLRLIDVVNPPGVLRYWLFDHCEKK